MPGAVASQTIQVAFFARQIPLPAQPGLCRTKVQLSWYPLPMHGKKPAPPLSQHQTQDYLLPCHGSKSPFTELHQPRGPTALAKSGLRSFGAAEHQHICSGLPEVRQGFLKLNSQLFSCKRNLSEQLLTRSKGPACRGTTLSPVPISPGWAAAAEHWCGRRMLTFNHCTLSTSECSRPG